MKFCNKLVYRNNTKLVKFQKDWSEKVNIKSLVLKLQTIINR